ncbi:conserved hypothetical protein EF_0839/AHA_3917 [Lentibacillus halodurans]|uniref:2-dehydro-3-deoxy-phosphogluconate aldolase n=1 Tax=Lentibacillus halodurans TaxID=237679 RepID=A0A1I0XG62_9BACI|nr:KDGP aldolase [Lentibacillus halodurans]SFB00069.1 conserved hypothetical protein EF_0839/AHA_3917 [Lentibacillus halodurans]
MKEKWHDKFLFNFLAHDADNAAAILEAGSGYVVPGIVSDHFTSVDDAVDKVNELKKVSNVVSIGLGGGGNADNWRKVLRIAVASEPGHLNQPFETASYSQGYLDRGNLDKQVVNALVKPTGEVGKIQLANAGSTMDVEAFMDIAASLGIESIKMMPVHGTEHVEELVYLTRIAQAKGIRGVEPAGGINVTNIGEIMAGVKDIDIEFFMPHIFGSAVDHETGKTIPEKVRAIFKTVEGLL